MFGWLKRRGQLAIVRAAEEDIDRFIVGLRGADLEAVSMIVAVATHWRHFLADQGIDVLDPVITEARDHFVALKLNRLIAQVQKENPTFAAGLMVWLHTFRASTIPEIRIKGRLMWGELQHGFSGVEEAKRAIQEITGISINAQEPTKIPVGLEPEHR